MHQSGVASMEAGMQQPPAKKPKKSVSDFFKKKDSPVPKPVRNFRALKRALTDARERAITILVERWPAAHPSFTQKVLPDGAVPQQAAHYGCGGLWMAIVSDRGSLGWDEQANGKDVLFLYGKRGMQYWYYVGTMQH
jgi:hypothetical protein